MSQARIEPAEARGKAGIPLPWPRPIRRPEPSKDRIRRATALANELAYGDQSPAGLLAAALQIARPSPQGGRRAR